VILSPSTSDALRDFTPAQFDLPFDFVKTKIEDGMRAKIKVLKDKMTKLNEQNSATVTSSSTTAASRGANDGPLSTTGDAVKDMARYREIIDELQLQIGKSVPQ
jgi:hypothetical protein